MTPRCTIVGRWASSRQRPFAAPHSGPTRMMIGRRGVSEAATVRICSPTHFDSLYALPAASHALTGPSRVTGSPVPSRSEVGLRELSGAPRRVSVELMNRKRGGAGRGLERAKSTRLRSMRKLPSKMLRDRLSSDVDSHALCTTWVTEERSYKEAVSLLRHVFRLGFKVPVCITLAASQNGFESRPLRGKSTLDHKPK